ncbi:MAG: hypothetical protein JNM85_09440 [Chthonomonas sp.]|nr:hypothetical protein [Chthonomonas sp.]
MGNLARMELVVREGQGAQLSIKSYAWQPTETWRPDTQVLLAHSPVGVLVAFEVHDQFLLGRYQGYDDPVYQDSCVEFFFNPLPGRLEGYYNIEVNVSGGVKFNYQRSRGVDRRTMPEGLLRDLRVDPGVIIDPEHGEPMVWRVSYVVPWEAVSSEDSRDWRANFYKCCEDNSHPHFGSWSPIETESPDFHRPEFFGTLRFE